MWCSGLFWHGASRDQPEWSACQSNAPTTGPPPSERGIAVGSHLRQLLMVSVMVFSPEGNNKAAAIKQPTAKYFQLHSGSGQASSHRVSKCTRRKFVAIEQF